MSSLNILMKEMIVGVINNISLFLITSCMLFSSALAAVHHTNISSKQMYLQTAGMAMLEPAEEGKPMQLKLLNTNAQVVHLSKGISDEDVMMKLQDFIDAWVKGSLEFSKSPTVTFVAQILTHRHAPEPKAVILRLENPVYSLQLQSVTYDAYLINSSLPDIKGETVHFKDARLFIPSPFSLKNDQK